MFGSVFLPSSSFPFAFVISLLIEMVGSLGLRLFLESHDRYDVCLAQLCLENHD